MRIPYPRRARAHRGTWTGAVDLDDASAAPALSRSAPKVGVLTVDAPTVDLPTVEVPANEVPTDNLGVLDELLVADPHGTRTPRRSKGQQSHGRSLKTKASPSDSIFRAVALSAGGITVSVMLLVGIFLTVRASDALGAAGPSFLVEQAWSPETGKFGIAAVLFGTVSIALVAMTISVPLALGTSLLISEVLRGSLQRALVTIVDLMAAIPSVVFGLWGVFFLQENVIPVARWISTYFSWIPALAVTDAQGQPLWDASAFTSSAFIAGIVVALMVVPTQTSVMREAFSQAPVGEREGALALGATRLGMIQSVVLPFGRGGIIGGVMLGLGRALGETIAVYMIVSPIFTINWQVLKTGSNSVSALIALRYGESSAFSLSALMAAGLVLFLLTLVVNFSASSIVARSRSGASSQ